MTFTDEQLAAIRSDAARLVISAGAGAGKTRVIVERIVRHALDDGIPLESITAISFTRKSSAELRARLVARLREAGRDDLAVLAETGVVRTVDAWAADTLRSRAAFAGIDPTFEPLREGDAASLAHEAARVAIAAAPELGPAARDTITHLTRATGDAWGSDPRGVYGQAELAIVQAMQGLRKGGRTLDDVAAIYRDERTLGDAFRAAIREHIGPKPASHLADGPDLAADLKSAFGTAGETIPTWAKASGTLYASLGLARLAIAAWRWLESEMDRTARFDYDGISLRLAALLESRADLAASLRDRNRIVIVDEAQDLSPLQMRLLETLGPESLVYVGDLRQSIYRFRDADPALFRDAMARFAHLELTVNHRLTDARLGHFLDGFFGTLWEGSHVPIRTPATPGSGDPPVSAIRRRPDDWDIVVRTAAEIAPAGPLAETAILVQRTAEGASIAVAAARIGLPVTTAPRDERMVLGLEVRDVLNALAAAVDPLDDGALLALLHSPAGGFRLDDLAELAGDGPVYLRLQARTDRPDVRAFLGWFDRLASVADRYPAWEIVGRLYADSPLLEAYARHPLRVQAIPRLRKLAAMAVERPEETTAQFIRRLRELQEIRFSSREGDGGGGDAADRIRVMTVFAAKGLEFDRVILAGSQFKGPHPSTVRIDRTRGLLAYNAEDAPSPAYAWLEARELAQHHEENERKLYVAFTRARQRLVIFSDQKVPTAYKLSVHMAKILGGELPGLAAPLPPEGKLEPEGKAGK